MDRPFVFGLKVNVVSFTALIPTEALDQQYQGQCPFRATVDFIIMDRIDARMILMQAASIDG